MSKFHELKLDNEKKTPKYILLLQNWSSIRNKSYCASARIRVCVAGTTFFFKLFFVVRQSVFWSMEHVCAWKKISIHTMDSTVTTRILYTQTLYRFTYNFGGRFSCCCLHFSIHHFQADDFSTQYSWKYILRLNTIHRIHRLTGKFDHFEMEHCKRIPISCRYLKKRKKNNVQLVFEQ